MSLSNSGNSIKISGIAADAKFQDTLAKLREKLNAQKQTKISNPHPAPISQETAEENSGDNSSQSIVGEVSQSVSEVSSGLDKFGNEITYNARQTEFIKVASQGEHCILIGAAGTGKTTSQRGAILNMIQNGLLPVMSGHDHKYLPSNVPGIVICAFTRRATNNIRRNLPLELQSNCITIHKLLEYEPVYFETINEETGDTKNTMRFEATRNRMHPIPESVKCIVIEESSMVSVELYRQIEEAAPHCPQIILLGDIQQLPPVFGSAILGYKMLEWKTVELTEVYRQALDSPIISLAHRILSGRPIKSPELKSLNVPSKLTLHPWIKPISAESATLTLAKFFIAALEKNKYDPETDAILIPFNKSCGTIELNNHIANTLAQKSGRPVYEIIHGWKRSYYSIGDKCLYDKEDCVIVDIYRNPEYSGVEPREESIYMDYWGNKRNDPDSKSSNGPESGDDVDLLLQNVAAGNIDSDTEERVRAASHTIVLRMLDSEIERKVKATGEINNLDLGYAITVHKSQGSEFDKVFLCLHKSHATMMQRELLYTAVTRAKRELYVICESDSFEKGIMNQRIKGNTLAEKAEYFKGKLENGELQS